VYGNGQVNQEGILDGVCTRIIETAREPKSIREISVEYEIPLSTVYRRVYKLCDCNMLKVYASEIRDGKRCLLYKTKNGTVKSDIWEQRESQQI
jgi:predicted transcriptional regulator